MRSQAIVDLVPKYLEKNIEVLTINGCFVGEWYFVDLHARLIGLIIEQNKNHY